MNGQNILEHLRQIAKNYKLENPIPCVIAMNPEFYNTITNRKVSYEINETIANNIPAYTGIHTVIFPKLPIPWKAYYTWEEFKLDTIKYK